MRAKRRPDGLCDRCGESIDRGHRTSSLCFKCGWGYYQDPLRKRARGLVDRAIKRGELPPAKTQECKDCGNQAFCYDHRDYNRPLMVDAVCKKCDARRGPGSPPIPNKYGSRIYPKLTEVT